MATGGEVLTMLCPNAEWTISGDDYDSINWYGKPPAINKDEFLQGFDDFSVYQSAKNQEIATAKSALLAKLGITEEEAKLLLS